MESNGKTLPQITIGWDAQTQSVHVNAANFQSMGFVIALLDMAKRSVEQAAREQDMRAFMDKQNTAALNPEEETITRRILRR